MAGLLPAVLDQTSVVTALPTIMAEFGGLEQISWVVTAYLLAMTVALPLLGKIGDLYGPRRVFRLSLGVFVAGAVFAMVAQSMLWLVLARAVQGIGAGGLLSMAQVIIGDVVPARQRGRYQGYLAATFASASVIGPLLGGLLVDIYSWRLIFAIALPACMVAFAVIRRALPPLPGRGSQGIDAAGATLLTHAITALLLAFVWGGPSYGWAHPLVLGLCGSAGIALALFVSVELRAKEPIVPLDLFRDPVFTVGSMLSLVVGFGMFGTIAFLPLWLQGVMGTSASTSGLPLVAMSVGLVVTSLVSGRLITRTGRYKLFPIIGTGLLVIGYAMLASLDGTEPLQSVFVGAAVIGAALGMIIQVVVLAIQNSIDHRHLGAATSAVQFFRQMGGTLGVATYGTVLNARLASHLRHLPNGAIPNSMDIQLLIDDPAALNQVSAVIQGHVRVAFAESLAFVFALGLPVTVIAFLLALSIRERPLSDGTTSGA
jgi:EmrB/QacA subfamily drug resistance transporter